MYHKLKRMSNQETLLNNELEKARQFMLSKRTGEDSKKAAYFKLAHLRSLDSDRKFPGSSFYQNFNYQGIDESLADLKNAVQLYGPTSQRYILLSLVSEKKANNNHLHTIQNPYYMGTPSNTMNNTPNSGQEGGVMFQMLLQMQQQAHEREMKQMEKLAALQRDIALRDQEEEIAGANPQDIFNQISGFLNSEAGQMVLGFLNPSQTVIQVPAESSTTKQEQAESKPDGAVPPETEEVNRIFDSINRIQNAIPGINMVEAFEQLATMTELNPNMAAQILKQKRTT